MNERRQYQRIPVMMEVSVHHPRFGSTMARTVDVSDGGLLVSLPGVPYQVGDQISVQACGIENAPVLKCTVVRIGEEGVALSYVEDAGG